MRQVGLLHGQRPALALADAMQLHLDAAADPHPGGRALEAEGELVAVEPERGARLAHPLRQRLRRPAALVGDITQIGGFSGARRRMRRADINARCPGWRYECAGSYRWRAVPSAAEEQARFLGDMDRPIPGDLAGDEVGKRRLAPGQSLAVAPHREDVVHQRTGLGNAEGVGLALHAHLVEERSELLGAILQQEVVALGDRLGREVGDEALDELAHPAHVTSAHRRGGEQPARAEDPPHLSEGAGAVGHVVEHEVRQHQVEAAVGKGQVLRVGGGEAQPGLAAQLAPGLGGHPWRQVGADHAPPDGAKVPRLTPEVSRPASELQHPARGVNQDVLEEPAVQAAPGDAEQLVQAHSRVEVAAVAVLLLAQVGPVGQVSHHCPLSAADGYGQRTARSSSPPRSMTSRASQNHGGAGGSQSRGCVSGPGQRSTDTTSTTIPRPTSPKATTTGAARRSARESPPPRPKRNVATSKPLARFTPSGCGDGWRERC